MNSNVPTWLDKWVTISEKEENINITIFEKHRNTYKQGIVEVRWEGPASEITEVQLNMKLKDPSVFCSWKPHLAPNEDMVIGDLVFRSPFLKRKVKCLLWFLI